MENTLIEPYFDSKSPIHEMDPALKILCTLSFIVVVVSTKTMQPTTFLLHSFMISSVVFLAKLPPKLILRRLLTLAPIVAVLAFAIPFTAGGAELFVGIVAKSVLALTSAIILVSTTKSVDLLQGLRYLKVPKIMVLTMSFMVRYISVITDELIRMRRARDLRSCGGNIVWQMKTAGNIVGNLFVRSYERAERIYLAMVVRGYAGEIKTLSKFSISAAHLVSAAAFVAAAVAVRLMQ